VLARMGCASKTLVEEKGADCVLLGCAGMTDMVRACEKAVTAEMDGGGETERRVNVIDGVEVGVHFLIALVRAKLRTSNVGIYRSADEGRKARRQAWL
jgi:Asp/Glu/hydantoin racemase